LRASSIPSQSRSRIESSYPEEPLILQLGRPLLFHWAFLGTAVILLLYSAFQHIVAVLAVVSFYLAFAIVSLVWSRNALRKVTCQFKLDRTRAFPGEIVDLRLELTNGKWLFLPWLEIEVELPYRLATGDLRRMGPFSRERIRWLTSISGGERIKWTHALECKARGEYELGPVRARSGDMLGLYPREAAFPSFEALLVYPSIVPIRGLGSPMNELVGQTVATFSLCEDVSRTVGTRDYRYEDPFKRIQWKASARRSQLQVRQYEATTSLNLFMVLDVLSFSDQTEESQEYFELALTTLASVANEACREQLSFGLTANSRPATDIQVGNGRAQLLNTLEALARMEATSDSPLDKHLNRFAGVLPFGSTLLVVTQEVSEELLAALRKLEQDGRSLLLVVVAADPRPPIEAGIETVAIRSLSDIAQLSRVARR
jgi:uncharacterized protein (DUF58 family)